VVALFNDLALLHDQNLICVLDGGESVRDHDRCDMSQLFLDRIDGLLHSFFVFLVQS